MKELCRTCQTSMKELNVNWEMGHVPRNWAGTGKVHHTLFFVFSFSIQIFLWGTIPSSRCVCFTPCRHGCGWYSSCYPKMTLPYIEINTREGREEGWQESRPLAMPMSHLFNRAWIPSISWLSSLWANTKLHCWSLFVSSFLLLVTDPLLTAGNSRWESCMCKGSQRGDHDGFGNITLRNKARRWVSASFSRASTCMLMSLDSSL